MLLGFAKYGPTAEFVLVCKATDEPCDAETKKHAGCQRNIASFGQRHGAMALVSQVPREDAKDNAKERAAEYDKRQETHVERRRKSHANRPHKEPQRRACSSRPYALISHLPFVFFNFLCVCHAPTPSVRGAARFAHAPAPVPCHPASCGHSASRADSGTRRHLFQSSD